MSEEAEVAVVSRRSERGLRAMPPDWCRDEASPCDGCRGGGSASATAAAPTSDDRVISREEEGVEVARRSARQSEPLRGVESVARRSSSGAATMSAGEVVTLAVDGDDGSEAGTPRPAHTPVEELHDTSGRDAARPAPAASDGGVAVAAAGASPMPPPPPIITAATPEDAVRGVARAACSAWSPCGSTRIWTWPRLSMVEVPPSFRLDNSSREFRVFR